MKKNLFIFVAILTLMSFGTASSAHAFFVPLVWVAITVAAGSVSIGVAALMNDDSQQPEETAQVQDQQEDKAKTHVRDETDMIKETKVGFTNF